MSDPNRRRPRGNPNMRKGAPSVNPSGRARADAADVETRARIDEITARLDSWQNLLTGAGVSGLDKRTAQAFKYCPITPHQGRELWLGDDIAARIVEEIPGEAVRQGWQLKIGDEAAPPPPKPKAPPGAVGELDAVAAPQKPAPFQRVDGAGGTKLPGKDPKELQEWLDERLKKLGVKRKLWEAGCHERATGGCALLIGAQDGATDLRQPLNLDAVRSLDWLTLLEFEEIVPSAWYTDPMADRYGEVEIWRLNASAPGSPGPTSAQSTSALVASREIHETRLIVFPGIKVSRRLQTQSTGLGDNVFSRVWAVLQDFNGAYGSAGTLVHDFAQAVWGISGLAELVAMDKSKVFQNRVRDMELARSTLRATVIDAEGETFERKATPVTGLPELLDRFERRLAAATGMPLTRLMGMSPGGLNATGESDQTFFYDKVKTYQEERLQPALERIIEILLRVAGAEVDSWSIEWCPLWQPTEKEKAEVRKIYMEIDTGYIGLGVYTEQECAVNRFGGDTWSSEMRLDFSARAMAEREEALQTAKAQELEVMQSNALAKGGPPGAKPEPDMVEQAGIPRGDAFDPDQERDGNGMWTAGGASAGRAKTPEEKAARTAKHREKANKEGERVLQARVEAFKRNAAIHVLRKPNGMFDVTPEEDKELEERGRELNKDIALDAAKNEFEYLEREAAETDRIFDEIEKRGIKGPAVKSLNEYKAKAGEVGKALDRGVREVHEKLLAAQQAHHELSVLGENLFDPDEDRDDVTELEMLADEIDMDAVSEGGIGEDERRSLASIAGSARTLSHIGNGTTPRDVEIDRLADNLMEEPGDAVDIPASFEKRVEAMRAATERLAAALDAGAVASAAFEKDFKAQVKLLDKAHTGAVSELSEHDLNDDPLVGQALEHEEEARGLTMAELDEYDPREITRGFKSARKAVEKVRKSLAKIPALRAAKSEKFTQGRTGLEEAKARLAARKAAEE